MPIKSGEAQKEFGNAVVSDLQGILTKLEEAHGEIIQLEEIVRGVDGMSPTLLKHVRTLELMETELKTEVKDAPNKIAGLKSKKGPPMTEKAPELRDAE